MPTIKETFKLTASDSDVLAAPSRLAAIPRNGVMTIEVSITDADATNFGQITLQLPNGDIPFEDLDVPLGNSAADFSMHEDLKLAFTVQVDQGGHVLLQYTEAGAVTFCFMIVTLQF